MKGPRFKLPSLVFAILLAANVAHAQSDEPKDSSSQPPAEQEPPPGNFSESVVVTANRLEQPGTAVPASVVVLTSEDIQRSSAKTVDQLLLQVAGFSQLHQSESHVAHPSTRTAALRGLGGGNSRTLVLVDGIPLNEPFGGVVYWSRVPLDSIERIEIVKSGASGVWGNLALGGVIHIITKSQKAGAAALHAAIEGGSNSTGHFSAGVQGSRGRVSAAATAAYYRSDGYMVIPEEIAGSIDRAVRDDNAAITGKVEYRVSPTMSWTMGGNFYHERQNAGTPLTVGGINVGAVNGQGAIVTSGGSRWQITGFVNHQNSVNLSTTIAVDRASETPSSDQFKVPGTASGVNVQWSRQLSPRHLASAGTDAQWLITTLNENYNFAAGRLSRLRQAGSDQLLQGFYAEDFIQVNPHWHLVASARLDRWNVFDARRLELDIATQNVLRDERYADRHVSTFNPSVGTVFRAMDRLSFRGSVYRGFRAPSPNEMFRPFRSRGNVLTESNAALDPERLIGGEGGVDLSVRTDLHVKVTAFTDYLSNAITAQTIGEAGPTTRTIVPCGIVPANGTCRQRANVGQLRSRGVETSVRYRPRDGWAFGVNYVYDPSRVTQNPTQPAVVGLLNRHSPIHQMVVDGSYENPRLAAVSVLVRRIGTRFDDDLNTLRLAPFSTVDLRVARRLTAATEAFFAVRNLSNELIEASRAGDGTLALGAPRLIDAGLSVRF